MQFKIKSKQLKDQTKRLKDKNYNYCKIIGETIILSYILNNKSVQVVEI